MRNLLALLADFANGVFAVLAAGFFTGTEIIWWHFPIGILCAMCPDLDALPELIKRGKVAASDEYTYDHRELLHYPLAFLVAGLILSIYTPFFGTLFLVATTLHFFNDLYGTGWGIPLLWPFSATRYKLLGRRVNRLKVILQQRGDWERLPHDERRLRLFVSWKPYELQHYINTWGLEEWIQPYYQRINWISGIEYTLFAVAVVTMLFNLLY